MRIKLKYINQVSLLLLAVLSVNISIAQYSNTYSLLFTGNTSENHQYNEELIKKWQTVSKDSENVAFLLLGNVFNTEEYNFPKEIISKNKQPLLLAPGEKEWANGRSSGKEMIKDIEENLKEKHKGQTYMPDAACPGPKEVVLNEHLVIILIDTYWWVHKHDRRFINCDIETDNDVLILIEDAIKKHYPNKHVVLAGNSSLKSYGNSDGYFSNAQSILGAPYILYRKILGTRKDNHHPDFKEFRDGMLSILKKYPDLIYLSAGDANLQYFILNNVHHIISGSINKTGFVNSKSVEFGSNQNGFAQLNFSDNGSCELIFIGSDEELFRKPLYQKEFDHDLNKNIVTQFPDSIRIKVGNSYDISEKTYFMRGKNYRNVWNTPVKVPVFNINTKKDSLYVIKRGGGKQTLSLRLEDKTGKQYVLRSFEKNIEPILPNELKNTFAVDLVQDQISTSNPYAAVVVAKLAEYAGIYHTNPEIVYVPNDPNFGIFREDVADQLFIFEERPDGDRSDVASFGYSKNIISTDEMIENILNEKDHFIDSEAYLRARLFDILINDWDRHEDQWRWASFKLDKTVIYRPIPRDRDQAFFLNEGVISWISARKWLSPRFQQFDEFTENVEGLSFNARLLDRNLLIQNDWEDWQRQIDSLKTLLTDERIDNAMLSFPKEIQTLCSEQTAEILKARLENLEKMARQLYLFLAEEVSITGSNSKDMFEIDVSDNKTIRISRFEVKNHNEIYSRVFKSSETKNIRIYGFDDKDEFKIKGNNKNRIKLSVIGGNGEEKFVYKGSKSPNYISVYKKDNTDLPDLIKRHTINIYDEEEIKYDRAAFKYDITYPGIFMGFNQDDGVFIGGGPIITKYSRYHQQRYEIFANYAFATSAFNIHFASENIFPLKRIELGLDADYNSPNYVYNYFGMGNETEWLDDNHEIDYYRVRMSEFEIKPKFSVFLDKRKIHKGGISIFYKVSDPEETSGRFISDYSINGLETADLLSHSFAGISFNYKINTVSNREIKQENKFGGSQMFPTRGLKFESEFSKFFGLNDYSRNFYKITSEWTSYLSFSKRPRIVYAFRFGGEKLFGDYVFTEAIKLGQKKNLRGYRQTRFYGDAGLYLNTEIRVRVKDFKSYLLNGTAGFFVFNDVGRVWLDEENSSKWHDGYGGGLWWAPFDMALISVSYEGSNEDNLINISLNYQF